MWAEGKKPFGAWRHHTPHSHWVLPFSQIGLNDWRTPTFSILLCAAVTTAFCKINFINLSLWFSGQNWKMDLRSLPWFRLNSKKVFTEKREFLGHLPGWEVILGKFKCCQQCTSIQKNTKLHACRVKSYHVVSATDKLFMTYFSTFVQKIICYLVTLLLIFTICWNKHCPKAIIFRTLLSALIHAMWRKRDWESLVEDIPLSMQEICIYTKLTAIPW